VKRNGDEDGSWDSLDVPLGEASEAYVVRVMQAGQVRREAIVPTAQWAYPAASRSADGVAAPFELYVAQLSEIFGPGPFARILINE